MATLDEIRRELDRDELDYPGLAQTHGVNSLPQLRSLVAEDEPRIASKAAYLAGVIAGGNAKEVVALAAQSRHEVIRVAAAAAAAMLPADDAVEITSSLLQDTDARVRVRAIKSAETVNNPILIGRLKVMAGQEPEMYIRDFAAGVARKMEQR
jgi:HEAT repeat protein